MYDTQELFVYHEGSSWTLGVCLDSNAQLKRTFFRFCCSLHPNTPLCTDVVIGGMSVVFCCVELRFELSCRHCLCLQLLFKNDCVVWYIGNLLVLFSIVIKADVKRIPSEFTDEASHEPRKKFSNRSWTKACSCTKVYSATNWRTSHLTETKERRTQVKNFCVLYLRSCVLWIQAQNICHQK